MTVEKLLARSPCVDKMGGGSRTKEQLDEPWSWIAVHKQNGQMVGGVGSATCLMGKDR